ncbi:hypothetical protein KGA66_03020 [Actinocrinis puniceicyclus]|uniref:Uncharacterized protein n=1 Tax=Actinocrinis puniceicyclus TaxID=977794 RepID=A0A8J8BCP9_9ACTN|nr:hypothetical protein [Actinocrinis puniceicyclus]MBS2962004.1 hypothetical protein [Actinocrinis puniceicyclus]
MNGNASGRTQRLDQIVFRWDSRNAAENGGYGPAAYSCDPLDARAIHEQVRIALRPDEPQPRRSVGRLSLSDGRALAFRRVPGSDSSGRPSPVCHAVVGGGALLDPMRCLALRHWRWPSERVSSEQVGRVLQPIDADSVRIEARNEHDALTRGLHDDLAQFEFTALLAAVLKHPRARLLVLERDLAAEPTALAYGLAELFGRFLPEPWNFSSFETRDSGVYQLAFTPTWPQGATEAPDLIRVDLHSPDLDPRIVPVARQVAALHACRDDKGVEALSKAAEGAGFPDFDRLERILQGQRAPVRLRPSRTPRERPDGTQTAVGVAPPAPVPPAPLPPTSVPPAPARRVPVAPAPVTRVPVMPLSTGPTRPSPTTPAARPSVPRSTQPSVPAPLPQQPQSQQQQQQQQQQQPRATARELSWLQQTSPRRLFPLLPTALRVRSLMRRPQPMPSSAELLDALRLGGTEVVGLEQSLARCDDLTLVDLIDWEDPQPAAHLVLRRLWSSRPQRTARRRTRLALRVLDTLAVLEDQPRRSCEPRLDLAEALFNVAVRPDARSREVRERLTGFFRDAWSADSFFGRDLMYRVVDEDKPLGIPEQAYRALVSLQAAALGGVGAATAPRTARAVAPTAPVPSSRPSAARTALLVGGALVAIGIAIALGMILRR